MLTAKPPAGYRADSTSGVLVPIDVAKKRVVLTKPVTQKLDNGTRAAKEVGLLVQFACKECGPSVRLQLVRDNHTGFMKLICNCSERVLTGGV